MSLLDDYEELCNAQDIGIFRETLDEVLKPILITLEERYFELNLRLDDLNIKILDLKCDVQDSMKGWECRFNQELNYAYDMHNTKLHNIWADVLKLQDDIESIKLNLKK